MSTMRRKERLQELILRELSQYLIKEVQNPNIGFTTIVAVELSDDLSHAKVSVSVMGTPEQEEKTMEALRVSAGYLQYLLGKNLRIRFTPILHFKLTHALADGDRMVERIISLKEELKEEKN